MPQNAFLVEWLYYQVIQVHHPTLRTLETSVASTPLVLLSE